VEEWLHQHGDRAAVHDPGRLAAEGGARQSGPGVGGGDDQAGGLGVEVLTEERMGIGGPPQDPDLDGQPVEGR